MKRLAIVTLLGLTCALTATAVEKQPGSSSTKMLGTPTQTSKMPSAEVLAQVRSTQDDIRKTLGIVPSFLKRIPPESLPGVWSELKSVQLNPNTAIPGKYKELIALAVAAQIPCRYCTYFHTEATKQLNGGSEREILESIAIAADSRHWSTFLNGGSVEMTSFRTEVDQIFEHLKKQRDQQAGTAADSSTQTTTTAAASTDVNSAEWAYQDMQKVFGVTPNFIRTFPESGVSGAWRALKGLFFTETAIPSKYKSLISLAVSANVPCQYCVYFDRKSLALEGVTEKEIGEALVMGSLVRYLSTVLNGSMQDEGQFRTEVAQVFRHVKKSMSKSQQIGKVKQVGDQAGAVGAETVSDSESTSYPLER